MALLPKLLLALSKTEGIPTKSHIERAAAGKYYYFMVFNVFLGITIFGAVFSSSAGFKELINQSSISVSKVVELLGSKLPPVATYYITFVALKWVLLSLSFSKNTSASFLAYPNTIWMEGSFVQVPVEMKWLCLTQRVAPFVQVLCWLWFRNFTNRSTYNFPHQTQVSLQDWAGTGRGLGTRTLLLSHQCSSRPADLNRDSLLLGHCSHDSRLLIPLLLHRMARDAQLGKIPIPLAAENESRDTV